MLHKGRVLKSIYYATRRRLRQWILRRGPRPQPPPVLREPVDAVVERHGVYLRILQDNLPPGLDFKNKHAIEVGPGDCLAVASHLLGLGAAHVDMVEVFDPVVNDKQRQVLQRLKEQGYAMDLGIIVEQDGKLMLDPKRVAFHQCFLENLEVPVRADFMFSQSVMEHVEDLDGFYKESARIMAPGGWMIHSVDLGGHELFEDPLPPLDFQTYPNALYWLMHPRYYRATRFFLDEHIQAIERQPFTVKEVRIRRRADAAYLDALWPKLRSQAKSRSKESVGVVEFIVVAQRKP